MKSKFRTVNDILECAQKNEIDFIRLMFVNPMGEIRSADIPLHRLESAIKNGISVHPCAISMGIVNDDLNKILMPDIPSFRIVPMYSSRDHDIKMAFMFGDIHEWDGTPSKLCPRAALKKTLATILEDVIVGTETEWFYKNNDGTFGHRGGNIYFNDDFLCPKTFTRLKTAKNLEQMGIQIAKSDLDGGKAHEISLLHLDAVSACDNLILARRVIQDTSRTHSEEASFIPKPGKDLQGAALHLNISLNYFGRNVFWDNGKLSVTADKFAQGILDHSALLNFFLNSKPDSYDRIDPRFFVVDKPCVGLSSANTIRTFCRSEESTYLEIRNGDNYTNPYLALTAIVSAGRKGMFGTSFKEFRYYCKNIAEATELMNKQINSGREDVLGVPAEMIKLLIDSVK